MGVEDDKQEGERMASNLVTFYDHMRFESDRGAVIVSVSLLDDILSDLLKSKLAPSLEKNDELFDSAFSPFSTFSAKIDLGYRLGLLKPSLRASLHMLRKVRNNFAHTANVKGFDHQSTQSRIRELIKLNSGLLKTFVNVLNDSGKIDIHIKNEHEIVECLGWRPTLQILFAMLATGMSESALNIKSIKALTDN